MNDFLNGILKETDQSELGSSRAPMNDFLNRIIKETDQSEPGSHRAPNV